MKGIIKELFGWIVFIVIVAAASYLVVAFVGQRTQVSGESMETTLSDGDHLIVDKISYRSVIRNAMTLWYFLTDMRRIHIISRGSSVFRERRCRSWMVMCI